MSPLDILIVHLPIDYGSGRAYGLPPLGGLYLATTLRDAGFRARILDASIKGLSLPEIEGRVKDLAPHLLAFSVLTPHLRSLKTAIDHFNTLGWRGRIICGGPHFNDTQGETLDVLDIDFAMHGESELSLAAFVSAFLRNEDMSGIPNLIRRVDGKVVVNPPGAFMDDLDKLPFPDLSLGETQDYEMIHGRESRAMSIMCSRGCPYLCTFCDVYSVWGRKVRTRSPRNVVDEMRFHHDRFGIREFFFRDSVFTLNYKWVDAFLDELEQSGLRVTWHCNARVDRVTEPMLKRMKSLGLVCVSFGIEAGNEEILKNVKKGINIATIERMVALTDRLGLQVNGYFMVGNPGETPDSARQTLDLALRLPATFIDVGPTVAYPGTEVYRSAVEGGYLDDRKWYLRDESMGHALAGVIRAGNPGQLNLPGFPPEEQVAFCRQFVRRFYLRPQTVYRIFFKHFSWRVMWRALKFLPGFLRVVLGKAGL
ncbi:MAG: radical SAM protein [Alphaproteobacteria bacterium]|nr:radical SAM protein [Alphaproteobacteria bacterium]